MPVVGCYLDGAGINKMPLYGEEAACFGERAVESECFSCECPDIFLLEGKHAAVKFYFFADSFGLVHQGTAEMVVGLEGLLKKEKRASAITEQEAEYKNNFACLRSCQL